MSKNELIMYLIQFIIAAVCFVLGRFVFPKVKEFTLDSDNEFIRAISDWVYKFVINAKYKFGDNMGSTKREWVFNATKSVLDKWGIELTEDQIYSLIQESYDTMKKSDMYYVKPVKDETSTETQTDDFDDDLK